MSATVFWLVSLGQQVLQIKQYKTPFVTAVQNTASKHFLIDAAIVSMT